MQQPSGNFPDPGSLSAGYRTASDSTGSSGASRDLSGLQGPSTSLHGGQAYAAYADAFRNEGPGPTLQGSPPTRAMSQTHFQQPGLGGHSMAYSQDMSQAAFQQANEGYQGQLAANILGQLNLQDWSHQAQLQQSLDQRAFLGPLQNQLLNSQARGVQPQQPHIGNLGSLLSQQLLEGQAGTGLGAQHLFPGNLPGVDSQQAPFAGKLPAMDAAQHQFPGQRLPPLSGWQGSRGHMQAQGNANAPLGGSPLNDLQLGMKHAYGGHEAAGDKKPQSWGHGHGGGRGAPHGAKGRQFDGNDGGSGPAMEKLRREVTRLHSELERMEKEVARQKNLREGERVEHMEAKEKLKSSWAADREDFARVKSGLKTKNAEHHAQSGRLSQQLKEMEAVCRGLRELCMRSGIQIPAELDQHHKHPTPLPSPSDTSYDSDVPDQRLASLATSVSSGRLATPFTSQPLSPTVATPTSPASTVLALMKQLPEVLARGRAAQAGTSQGAQRGFDGQEDGTADSDVTAQAAAQAAAALSQLAAALSNSKAPSCDGSSHGGSRPASPALSSPMALGEFDIEITNLNRMSLQSWVKEKDSDPQTPSDGCRSPISTRSSEPGRQAGLLGSSNAKDQRGATHQSRSAGSNAGSEEDFTLRCSAAPPTEAATSVPPEQLVSNIASVEAPAQVAVSAPNTTSPSAPKGPVAVGSSAAAVHHTSATPMVPRKEAMGVSSLAPDGNPSEASKLAPVTMAAPLNVPSDVTLGLPSATSAGMSDNGFVDSE